MSSIYNKIISFNENEAFKSKYFDYLIIFLFFFLVIILVKPQGDFPLNDDWAYAKSVFFLYSNSYFKILDFVTPTIFIQIIYGYLVSLIFGFSFQILRYSTIILSLISILTYYNTLLELKVVRKYIIYSILILFFNPIFFLSTFTFMTEIPFMTNMFLALYFLSRFIKTNNNMNYILFILFSIFSILIRQVGLFLPFSFMVLLFIENNYKIKSVIRYLLPIIICFIAYILYINILKYNNTLPNSYNYHFDIIMNNVFHPFQFAKNILKNLFTIVINIGMMTLIFMPLCIKWLIKYKFTRNSLFHLTLFSISIVFLGFSLYYHSIFFFWNNIHLGGLGPITILNDSNTQFYAKLPNFIWLIISFSSMLNGSFVIFISIFFFFEKIKSKNTTPIFLFSITSIFTYLGLLIFSYFFDRYFIILLPFLILILLIIFQSENLLLIFKPRYLLIPLFLFSFFSIAGMHDYFAWNRARWEGLNYLTNILKISPFEIDGGIEFNAWNCYTPKKALNNSNSNTWVFDNTYIVCFSDLKGFKKIKTYKFQRWLPITEGEIFILKKEEKSK